MKKYGLVAFMVLMVAAGNSCAGADRKEMKASEILELVKKGRPVQVVDRIIVDDLDFTAAVEPLIMSGSLMLCDIQSGIFFESCVFMGKVTASGVIVSDNVRNRAQIKGCFRSGLVFTGCDFRGMVDFEGATVYGSVNFGRSVFREGVNMNSMAVWAKDSYFSEMKAEKEFNMIYAAFAGNLHFLDAAITGNLSLQETSVQGRLMCNNMICSGRAGFDMMQVAGNAFFNYAKFEKMANFSWSRFAGSADFVNTVFEQPVNMERTAFMNTVRFDGADRAQLVLTDTFFMIHPDNN